MLVIVDIDGTLADLSVRYGKAPKPAQEDKAAFQAWVDKVQDGVDMMADKPIGGMQELLHSLNHYGIDNTIVYLTGRSNKYRQLTLGWLKLHDFPDGVLVMRKDDDWRKPSDYKEEHVQSLLLNQESKEFIALDDDYDGDCSAMYRRLGGTHLKVMGDRP